MSAPESTDEVPAVAVELMAALKASLERAKQVRAERVQCPHCASPRREWRFEIPNGDRVENCGNAWHDGVQAVGWR